MIDFLTAQGANLQGQTIVHFGDVEKEVTAAHTSSVFFYLPEVDTFILTAEDVKRWCNGMFSNNIRKLQPGQGNRSAICNDRGHVQGFIDVYCLDHENFLCSLDGIDITKFNERFHMFMVLDDIEMIDQDRYALITVQGKEATSVLQHLELPIPEQDHAHLTHTGIRICRKDRSGHGGFDLFVPHTEQQQWWSRLQQGTAIPGGMQALDTLRIMAGHARWPNDGRAKSLIHELGVNEECCAFDKGCYVGQEIINRIDVKGLINKKITRILLSTAIELGTAVLLNDKQVGTITSYTTYQNKHYGLALLRKSAWPKGTVLSVDGHRAETF